ncbi:hypothetical protein [Cupriavidus pauculus]|jgi:hypothetical protein|uniref:hypothetical protein n=1 Tax=Cupriavidus pauculus TaxID=82633 RepID=UPI001FD51CDD|nr:hypothetical protein [Cupriavidus pauculus]MCM3608023.1 hypothetical protein [Cupriavidus pauculus]
MTSDPRKPGMPETPAAPNSPENSAPEADHLSDALAHLSSAVESDSIATGAAKGLVYSVMETLGALIGDPDLPEHARSGYQGLLETARELRARLERGGDD